MVMIAVKCPGCGETNVSKNGKTLKGTQKYLCNNEECTHKATSKNPFQKPENRDIIEANRRGSSNCGPTNSKRCGYTTFEVIKVGRPA
jgi:hypothetical protein